LKARRDDDGIEDGTTVTPGSVEVGVGGNSGHDEAPNGANKYGNAGAKDGNNGAPILATPTGAKIPKNHPSTGADATGDIEIGGGRVGKTGAKNGNNGAPILATLTGADATSNTAAGDGANKFGMPPGADANISIEAMSEDLTSGIVGNGNGTIAGATGATVAAKSSTHTPADSIVDGAPSVAATGGGAKNFGSAGADARAVNPGLKNTPTNVAAAVDAIEDPFSKANGAKILPHGIENHPTATVDSSVGLMDGANPATASGTIPKHHPPPEADPAVAPTAAEDSVPADPTTEAGIVSPAAEPKSINHGIAATDATGCTVTVGEADLHLSPVAAVEDEGTKEGGVSIDTNLKLGHGATGGPNASPSPQKCV